MVGFPILKAYVSGVMLDLWSAYGINEVLYKKKPLGISYEYPSFSPHSFLKDEEWSLVFSLMIWWMIRLVVWGPSEKHHLTPDAQCEKFQVGSGWQLKYLVVFNPILGQWSKLTIHFEGLETANYFEKPFVSCCFDFLAQNIFCDSFQ